MTVARQLLSLVLAALLASAVVTAQGTSARVTALPVQTGDRMPAVVRPGTRVDVSLQTALDSSSARNDQPVEGAVLLDVVQGDRTLVPAGTRVEGFVASVRPADPFGRGGAALIVAFKTWLVHDDARRLRAVVEAVFDGKPDDMPVRLRADAAERAAIARASSGLVPRPGLLVGPTGAIASKELSQVTLPVGTILRIRLTEASPVAGGDD